MTRSGVIWRLERGADRLEALVGQRDSGECELRIVENGTLLERVWLAAGRGLSSLEQAIARRDLLKRSGWHECAADR